MSAVANRIAMITLRWVRPGFVSWDPVWVAVFGHIRLKEPDVEDYCSFAKYDLEQINGVVGVIVEPPALIVIVDAFAVSGMPRTADAEKAREMAVSCVLSICARHGFELDAGPED